MKKFHLPVKVKRDGRFGLWKVYEGGDNVSGRGYETKAEASRHAARVRKQFGALVRKERKNPAKSVRLSNFSGTVKTNANGTVSITGRSKKRNPSKRSARKRVGAALRKYVRGRR